MAKMYRFPAPGDQAIFKVPLRGLMEFRIRPHTVPNTISDDRVVELVSSALTDAGIGVEGAPGVVPRLNANVGLFLVPDLGGRVVPIVYLSVWGKATPLHQDKPTPMCLWRSPANHSGSCGADQVDELCATLLSNCLDEFIEHWKAANGVA